MNQRRTIASCAEGGAGAIESCGEEGAPRPLIFLGPSLPVAEAAGLCRGEYMPPICRGDLARFAGSAPRMIGIVDGAFHQRLAVSPNEILTAIAAGHRVYGAASMGALRAVELRQAGMIGIGRVYDTYARGHTERDDEVAVIYDPETGRSLSDALVNMRAAFPHAVSAGLLDKQAAGRAIRIAEELHYPVRTYENVLGRLGLPPRRQTVLLRFLRDPAFDVKARDTRLLLRHIAGVTRARDQRAPSSGKARRPPFTLLAPRSACQPERLAVARLPPAPKVPGWTSVRSIPAAETDAMLKRVRSRFGVTRVAEITQLDTLGIPCYSAIWPGTGISAYSGKSLDKTQARVGAQMEALEAALSQGDLGVRVWRASYDRIARVARALDPVSAVAP